MDTSLPLVQRAYNLGLKAVPNFVLLSEEQIAYYEEHTAEIPEALLRGFVLPAVVAEHIVIVQVSEKFELLADLGIMTTPPDYHNLLQLSRFKMKYLKMNKKFTGSFHPEITDQHFANVTRILKPGERFHVKAWKHRILGTTTTSEERLQFLKRENSELLGAQGTSLVFEEMRVQLPSGYWYVSFDVKKALWEDAKGSHRLPVFRVRSNGGYLLDLGYFDNPWADDCAFFSFREVA